MLHVDDDLPIVRNALVKRLDAEPGVQVCEVKMKLHPAEPGSPAFLAVGVLYLLDRQLICRARFDLPAPTFELPHILNEVDQIAEQAKAARKEYWGMGGAAGQRAPETVLAGTGLRGLWPADLM